MGDTRDGVGFGDVEQVQCAGNGEIEGVVCRFIDHDRAVPEVIIGVRH